MRWNWGSVAGNGRAVAEEDPVVPLPDRLGPDDQRQDDHHADPEPARIGTDDLLVPLDELVLGIERRALRCEALGHDEAGQQQHGEDDREGHHQSDLDLEQLEPDRVEVDRGEPQGIGVEDGEGPQGGDEDDQDDHGGDDPTAAASTGRGI